MIQSGAARFCKSDRTLDKWAQPQRKQPGISTAHSRSEGRACFALAAQW